MILTLTQEFWAKGLPALAPRAAAMPDLPGKIIAVIGMRRTGKTYFMFQHMQALLKARVPKDRLL